MATHSSILAWRIPWTEGPSGLQLIELTDLQLNHADKGSRLFRVWLPFHTCGYPHPTINMSCNLNKDIVKCRIKMYAALTVLFF